MTRGALESTKLRAEKTDSNEAVVTIIPTMYDVRRTSHLPMEVGAYLRLEVARLAGLEGGFPLALLRPICVARNNGYWAIRLVSEALLDHLKSSELYLKMPFVNFS